MANRLLAFATALFICSIAVLLSGFDPSVAAEGANPGLLVSPDATGQIETIDVNGPLDMSNPFFQELGTNGRSCSTCHRPDQGWTITPESVRQRFRESAGLDPIFRTNDGSNCEGADVSTPGKRRKAFSLLLDRGLIRVGIDVPPGAEFFIDDVDDPYRCGSSRTGASLYRRPLPATNLPFLSAVMWDGRESSSTTTILQDLAKQADDATTGHAQASLHLTPREAQEIVAFETGLYTAQAQDSRTGSLRADGASGGPLGLPQQPFYTGINDPVGLNPTGAKFNPNVFLLFDAWADASAPRNNSVDMARRAVVRGEGLFNSTPIVISGVGGLNNATFSNGVTVPSSFTGSCTTCHDTPGVGNHSVKAPLNIGLADASRRTPDMPLYTLRRVSTGETVLTTDPGRAMVTGKWADIGKFKGQILRGLAARAPYFHNGSARSLDDVVDFYDERFNIGLSPQDKADLVAFLQSL